MTGATAFKLNEVARVIIFQVCDWPILTKLNFDLTMMTARTSLPVHYQPIDFIKKFVTGNFAPRHF